MLGSSQFLLTMPFGGNGPDMRGTPLKHDDESTLEAGLRIAGQLDQGVLPIQGPPGTGKSYTGARMICKFLQLLSENCSAGRCGAMSLNGLS